MIRRQQLKMYPVAKLPKLLLMRQMFDVVKEPSTLEADALDPPLLVRIPGVAAVFRRAFSPAAMSTNGLEVPAENGLPMQIELEFVVTSNRLVEVHPQPPAKDPIAFDRSVPSEPVRC